MSNAVLERATLRTSRLMEFCSSKELVNQTGHGVDDWPLVILKELVDNALDACEEAGNCPEVDINVDDTGIMISDNGPGIPEQTIEGVLDFTARTSSREAYVAPDRGAQGNALKTLVAMPFALDNDNGGQLIIDTGSIRHQINITVDPIRQQPLIDHSKNPSFVKNGTCVKVVWPDSACSILADAKERFLQIADKYAFMNPHLKLSINWFGKSTQIDPTDTAWLKWRPSDPTSAYWYEPEHLSRLIAGYIADDTDHEKDRTVREFICEFRGLSGSAKQKRVLDATGLSRLNLSALADGNGIKSYIVKELSAAMRDHTKPVKPAALGVIGKQHLEHRFKDAGCDMESFQYRKVARFDDFGLPYVLEVVFGYCPSFTHYRLITGVNWSPGIRNPFNQLGNTGQGLTSVLHQQEVDPDDPVMFFMHCAYPRVEYTDRGKSTVIIKG